MIQQISNNSVRCTETHESDIDFLRKFYANHNHFPVFQQVLIETRPIATIVVRFVHMLSTKSLWALWNGTAIQPSLTNCVR